VEVRGGGAGGREACGRHPLLPPSSLRDVNKRAFLREAQKLVPSVTEDMVEARREGRRG
jgi:hypothetical protein